MGASNRVASNSDPVGRIRQHNARAVRRLFNSLLGGGSVPDWPAGKAFEYLVLRGFELEGASVTWPYSVRRDGVELEQVDGAVTDGTLHCLIESKHWGREVNWDAIAKLRAKLSRRPALAMGSIFSVKGFSEPAIVLAQYTAPVNVLLWNADDIEYGLMRGKMLSGLRRKIRHAIEHGFSDYNLRAEDAL